MKQILCILISIYSIEKSIKQRVELCNNKNEDCVNIVFSSLEELDSSTAKLGSILDSLKKKWCENVY